MQIYLFSHENGKINKWSKEIDALTPYIDFEHIMGKENVVANSLSRLQT